MSKVSVFLIPLFPYFSFFFYNKRKALHSVDTPDENLLQDEKNSQLENLRGMSRALLDSLTHLDVGGLRSVWRKGTE